MTTVEKKSNAVTGLVIASNEKTIKVKVQRTLRHPRYKKVVRPVTLYHVHDERCTAKIGDVVKIKQCRPHSKTKTWELSEIVN